MEDCGYMARAAFIMDKLMHKMGLHGKSFIPLIMGFGCNVPAIMATRTVESRRSRFVTMLLVPLMSCEARIPVYVMVIVAFFRPHQQPLVMMSLYLLGMLLAVVMSKIFTSFVFKGEDTPFVMELPPYRFPTWKAVGRHTWEKGRQYLKKNGWHHPLRHHHRLGPRLLPHTMSSSEKRRSRSRATSDRSAMP